MTILKTSGFILLIVAGCGPSTLTGRVSTAWYQPPPSQPAFTILSSNQLSLTDRQIGRLIEQKMIERGYLKVLVPEDANVAVMIIGYRSLKVLALWARI